MIETLRKIDNPNQKVFTEKFMALSKFLKEELIKI